MNKITGSTGSILICLILASCSTHENPVISYRIAMDDPSEQVFRVELNCSGFDEDTVILSMPAWMPGYYQVMNYAENVNNVVAETGKGKLPVKKTDIDTWQVVTHGKPFSFSYDVNADRRFVANSFLDSTHAYIVPASAFMFVEGHQNEPVSVTVDAGWKDFATGLDEVAGKANRFTAANFDMLYDCPILAGNLIELPSFHVNGIRHRFIGYGMGDFDGHALMSALKKGCSGCCRNIRGSTL